MLTKTFRPLFVAAAVAFMLMATVEAAPAAGTIRCLHVHDPSLSLLIESP